MIVTEDGVADKVLEVIRSFFNARLFAAENLTLCGVARKLNIDKYSAALVVSNGSTRRCIAKNVLDFSVVVFR